MSAATIALPIRLSRRIEKLAREAGRMHTWAFGRRGIWFNPPARRL